MDGWIDGIGIMMDLEICDGMYVPANSIQKREARATQKTPRTEMRMLDWAPR